MSGDKRKDLRLVKPKPPSGAEIDRASEALRAALAPGEIDTADHEALLAMVLGDEAAEVSGEEQTAAESLRVALEGGGVDSLADLARALHAAHREPVLGALDEADHDVIVAVSLDLSLGLEGSEAAESARLRAALERRGQHPLAHLAQALAAADHPARLEPADGEALLSLSLATQAEVSADARREAAELCVALEARAEHPLASWANALRAAAGQLDGIDELRHERLLRRALSEARLRPSVVVGALVAMAAGVALFLGSFDWRATSSTDHPVAQLAAPAELVVTRSTQELFDPTVPFGARGGETERVERILESRAADLRANRFASWGVR